MLRISTFFTLFTLLFISAQSQDATTVNIDWDDEPREMGVDGMMAYSIGCDGCHHDENAGYSPIYSGQIRLKKGYTVSNLVPNFTKFAVVDLPGAIERSNYPTGFYDNFTWSVHYDRGTPVLYYQFAAAEASGQKALRVVTSFELNFQQTRNANRRKSATFQSNSVLAQGEWYRIGLTEDGMYRLTVADLENLGIDLDQVDPQSINIYGNGYGMLPYENAVERPDDLLLNAIEVVGGEDGVLSGTDEIRFYAKGPNKWFFDEETGLFDHQKHNYTDTSYYFIGINTMNGPSRVPNISSTTQPATAEVTSFNDYRFHEVDRENMIKSGRDWYGEKFDVQTTYNFSGAAFTFPNIDAGAETVVRARVMSRSTVGGSQCKFTLNVNGENDFLLLGGVGTGVTSNFGRNGNMELRFNGVNPSLNINISYEKNAPSAIGWLNWFNINTRRSLRMAGAQMAFRDVNSLGQVARYNLTNAPEGLQVWDVTEPFAAKRINYQRQGNLINFTLGAAELREFIAFSGGYKSPSLFGSVTNQDLHALGSSGEVIDMIIVAPGQFMAKAEELADIHRNYAPEPLSVEVVNLQAIYNEFSSGMRDVTAIKWLMKMLHDRAEGNEALMTRYLLLFGDGSYDNFNIGPGNTNFIPTFQSIESLAPANSYVSDDYFTFLSDDEGEGNLDAMDMGVGRLVVKNNQEATSVVNKIRRYMDPIPPAMDLDNSNNSSFGSFRNVITLIADDEDGADHMEKSRDLSTLIQSKTSDYNFERIFLDAYQQETTPAGQRYPAVNEAINRRVRNGAFIINYIGHGGELGLAEERIIDIPTILDFNNGAKLPVFMTATCEFARFDDPLRTSAGEFVLLNGNGGGIALVTTTRLVYSSGNFQLNKNFYKAFLNRPDDEVVVRMGDLSRETKNFITSNSPNHRNFTLLGDPALPIAIPKHRAIITALTDTLGNPVDTLKALSVVRVNGVMQTRNGQMLSDFNGRLSSTVFDRVEQRTTLANPPNNNPFTFPSQESIVYRGNAEVINGLFQFDFVLPKDISFAVDSTARISLYGMGVESDATGFADSLKIGSRDPNAVNDGTEPRYLPER